MFRKITTFTFTNNKKISFFVLFFFHFFTTICQSNIYIQKNPNELKNIYLKLFQENAKPEEIKALWIAKYPTPQDTLIYQAKLDFQQENSLLYYYHQIQESLLWAFLGIVLLNLTFLLVVAPFIKWKKWFYLFVLVMNLVIFIYKRQYFLFQEWVFLPSNSSLYEESSFVSCSYIELSKPQLALVVQKKHFWIKIETENGNYWVPEFNVIK